MDTRKEIDLPLRGEYEEALAIAWGDLSSSNLTRVTSNALAEYDKDGRRLRVPFLNEKVTVEIEDKHVLDESGQEVRVYQAIIVLHYLLGAKPFGPSGNWLTFRELDSGKFYYSAYEKRSIARLIEVFGSDAGLLVKAAAPLGGEVIDIGDAGVRFDVFPKLPLAVVVWQGDAELSASANILFDGSAGSILTTEDLVVVAGFLADKLVKEARELSSE
jgi:hypothetical protein